MYVGLSYLAVKKLLQDPLKSLAYLLHENSFTFTTKLGITDAYVNAELYSALFDSTGDVYSIAKSIGLQNDVLAYRYDGDRDVILLNPDKFTLTWFYFAWYYREAYDYYFGLNSQYQEKIAKAIALLEKIPGILRYFVLLNPSTFLPIAVDKGYLS